jgi:ribosomal protein S18 acetylase RimI-like enzyme
MSLVIRPAVAVDAAAIGRICYEAFVTLADAHGLPRDFPSVEAAVAAAEAFVGHPTVYGVVAEVDGTIVGSNFLREYNAIASIGPISIDPAHQSGKIGRALMEAVLERAASRAFPGVRLVQAAHNRVSLALYLRLGFTVREPLACFTGLPVLAGVPGSTVRPAMPEDVAACDALCFRVHGHTRSGELARAVDQGTARVVERAGRITGYATLVAFNGHGVAETTEDLHVLIGAASSIAGPGLLVPLRNGELVRWCLAHGLRITQTMTLMTIGLYNEPSGAWFPSVIS